MTTVETDAAGIFADARQMHEAALERLAAGDIRDAAEKAWCATLRAVEGLVLARTGQEPDKSPDASRRLASMSDDDPQVAELRLRYLDRQDYLHGDCFYHALCRRPGTDNRIHQTADFIADARRLAGDAAL